VAKLLPLHTRNENHEAGVKSRTGVIGLCLGVTLSMSVAFCVQPPAVQWTRTFTSAFETGASDILQTDDGGYIAGGVSDPDTSWEAEKRYYLFRTDSLGNMLWARIDSNPVKEERTAASSLVQTPDGGYAMAGDGTSAADSSGIFLAKVDSAGNLEWRRVVEHTGVDHACTVLLAQDRGYFIAGSTPIDPDSGLFVMKTDSLGYSQWLRRYKLPRQMGYSGVPVRRTSDGGYVIGANALVKVDSSWNLQWTGAFDSLLSVQSMFQTDDRGYAAAGMMACGTGRQNDYQAYIAGLDSLGTLVWLRRFREYGGALATFVPSRMEQAMGGGCVLVGWVESGRDVKACVLRTDSSGNVIWERIFENWTLSWGTRVRATADGGYVIAGTALDDASRCPNAFLAKFAPER
jgi:hypothetical protein